MFLHLGPDTGPPASPGPSGTQTRSGVAKGEQGWRERCMHVFVWEGLGDGEGRGECGMWREQCKWTGQGWGGLGSFLPTTTTTTFYHHETMFRSVNPWVNSFARKKRDVSVVNSVCFCPEPLWMQVSLLTCPSELCMIRMFNDIAPQSVLGSYIIEQLSQRFYFFFFFLVKEWSNFQELLMNQESNWKE